MRSLPAPASDSRQTSRWWGALLLGLTLVLGAVPLAPPASAHAQLVGSSPTDGATLTAVPPEVVLRFSEEISRQFVTVTVTSGDGTDATQGAPRAEGARVYQPLNPEIDLGTYRVNYKVISADGHPVSGSLQFTYADPSTGGTSGSRPSRSSTPSSTTTSSSSPTSTKPTSTRSTSTTSSSSTSASTTVPSSTTTSPRTSATTASSSTTGAVDPSAQEGGGPPAWLLGGLGLLALGLIIAVLVALRNRRGDAEFDESFRRDPNVDPTQPSGTEDEDGRGGRYRP